MALSGNIEGTKISDGYKKGIIERYGEEYLDDIDRYREFKTLSCDDLILIRKSYSKLIRDDNPDDSEIILLILV